MTRKRYFPVHVETLTAWSGYIKLGEVAALCGIHPELVDRFVRLGLIDPVGRDSDEGQWIFHRETLGVVKKILRLRNELGINYVGVGVVLELLSRIEFLEERIRQLENELS
ncbi:MAG: MerR family transcriptional regulator [Deltaproteobacteria bacterium]|nr:MerR family transcriptional regulator [Deltaproteobacteria bacterium]MBW1920634.1 MerR family transcriptional regulator [Deltaproteobacteria bacterium]MBW1935971.1 MerR family transcriptional regulator [Deltaproteobacteria bacterium]MBW1978440.1 MerR family transcriptional regulator [Deltaproteobacteria bacterium]MBW2046229.1 MerR family transcriptional regulator [Deltaproteobacteria bacterium]